MWHSYGFLTNIELANALARPSVVFTDTPFFQIHAALVLPLYTTLVTQYTSLPETAISITFELYFEPLGSTV